MNGVGEAQAWYSAIGWSFLTAALVAAGAAFAAWSRRMINARRLTRGERHREFFVRLLAESPNTVRPRAPRDPPDAVVLDLLGDALERGGEPARARLLAFCEASGWIERWSRATWSVAPWRRLRAARWLGRLGSRRGLPDLIRLLDDPSAAVRVAAVEALGSISDPQAFSGLLRILDKAGLARGPGVPFRSLSAALAAHGPSAVEPLLARLRSGEDAVRMIAAEVLSCLPDPSPRVRVALLGALSDRNAEVRARAAGAFGTLGDAAAVVPLIETLGDGEWFVRLHAARSLGALGHSRAVGSLVATLIDESWQVRAAAADALRRIGGEAIPALTEVLLTSKDRYAKEQVVEELQRTPMLRRWIDAIDEDGRTGFAARRLLSLVARHGATSLLLDVLRHHPRASIRRTLATLLGEIALPQVTAALREVGERDPDAGVREAAQRTASASGDRSRRRMLSEGEAA